MSVPVLSARRAVPPAYLERLADGVFAYLQPTGGWCVSNSGLVTGGGMSALVDSTATERRARALRDAIGSVGADPPRVLVNTHHHGDHTFGNAVFAPDAVVVAHELTRSAMLDAGTALRNLWPDVDWGATPVVPPALTFADRMRMHIGDHRAELIHVGPAHTTNDTVVWLPDQRILFAGDVLWAGVTPFVLMGSVSGSLRAVERLRELRPDIVVPGHGPVGGPELLDDTADYLRWLQDIARSGLDPDTTPLELARRTDLGRFADLLDAERLVGNLHRCAAELAGLAEGVALPVAEIMREMVAFNGGRMPECLA